MTGLGAVAADNRVIAQFFAGSTHRSCAIRQVHTVQTQTLGQHDMRIDHGRHIVAVRDFTNCVGRAQDFVFVPRCKAQTQTGDFRRIQHGLQFF